MTGRPYIHELPDWPDFRWDSNVLAAPLAAATRDRDRLAARMQAFGAEPQQAATLVTLTEEVVTSSAIEGEVLDAEQVRSSVARRLGLDAGGVHVTDRNVEGVVEMMLDATQHAADPLTAERLFGWHAALFPSGRSGLRTIRVGAWRDDAGGPMRVVSGAIGREHVHFEAPSASRLDGEMQAFLEWFNREQSGDPVLKAALAHLWFVTIHPFDDGNGRIARAIADLALARADGSAQCFYSMSAQIRDERRAYYDILEHTQKGSMDVTRWMAWFVECLARAIARSDMTLAKVTAKARFWQSASSFSLNDRQRAMLNRLLDGFEGKLTNEKWAKITKVSPQTALRDITDLVEQGVLVRGEGGGRSTNYVLRQAATA